MNEDRLLNDVVRILRSCGLNAGVSHTGGGIICIVVSPADGDLAEPRFIFGTAGETWAAEVEGTPEGLASHVSSTESAPDAVAAGLLSALAGFAERTA